MRSKKNANQTSNNFLNSLNRNMVISPYVWTVTFYMISAVRLYMRRLSYTYMFYSMMVSYEVR